MTAGVVMDGSAAVDEVNSAVAQVRPYVLRVHTETFHRYGSALGGSPGHGGAYVRVVADPTLEAGQAVWMEPFPLPCPTLIVLGGSRNEIEAWAGSRGLRMTGGDRYPEVFAVWTHQRFSHLTGVTGDGLGLVKLPGWAEVAAGYEGPWARFEDQLRLKVDCPLPADWVPTSQRALDAEQRRLDRDRADRNERWRQLVSDLDRCVHWRHEGDACGGWRGPGEFDGGCRGGVSLGNPLTRGQVLGYTVHGKQIMQPADRVDRGDPAKWLADPAPTT